jgi:predicted lipoprotein with Yx(FWY)xxD motif
MKGYALCLRAVFLAFILQLAAFQINAQPTVMVTDNPKLGKILTDGQGMTLYMFRQDLNGSNCYGQCAATWPPLIVGNQPTGSPDLGGQLNFIRRTNNTLQATYNKMPLYYYSGDSKPGDTNGDGVEGYWYAIHPDLAKMRY